MNKTLKVMKSVVGGRKARSPLGANAGLVVLTGLGVGAGAVYLLNPDRGARRRAGVRDKLAHAAHKTGDAAGVTARDFANRTRGLVAGIGSLFRADQPSDEVLVARVRAKIGRYSSHPGSIEVTADRGRVTLSGPILKREVDSLLSAVGKVGGVTEVENSLEVHKQAGDIPGLQGGRQCPGEPFELMQANWSPTARLLTSAAGGGLVAYGVKRGGLAGLVLGAAGAALAARGLTNLELKRLTGVGGGRRAVDVVKTINIAAPVEQVFDFWRNLENFPRFMSNVREVRDNGQGCTHWVVAGPAGVSVEWDATVTQLIPNELIAWKTVPNSAVGHGGVVTFRANPDGGTQVNVRLSYSPPGGAAGHAIAKLFGADPKSELDADLMRLKTLVETGTPPRDANWRGAPDTGVSIAEL